MGGLVFPRRGFVLVVMLLASVVLVSGTSELPLMPPVDRAQSAVAWEAPTAQTPVHLLMIRLVRTFFGDQVKWSPFRRAELVVIHTHHHHRIVHEHHPRRPHLHALLAKRRFHLRGKPASTLPVHQPASHISSTSTKTSTSTSFNDNSSEFELLQQKS